MFNPYHHPSGFEESPPQQRIPPRSGTAAARNSSSSSPATSSPTAHSPSPAHAPAANMSNPNMSNPNMSNPYIANYYQQYDPNYIPPSSSSPPNIQSATQHNQMILLQYYLNTMREIQTNQMYMNIFNYNSERFLRTTLLRLIQPSHPNPYHGYLDIMNSMSVYTPQVPPPSHVPPPSQVPPASSPPQQTQRQQPNNPLQSRTAPSATRSFPSSRRSTTTTTASPPQQQTRMNPFLTSTGRNPSASAAAAEMTRVPQQQPNQDQENNSNNRRFISLMNYVFTNNFYDPVMVVPTEEQINRAVSFTSYINAVQSLSPENRPTTCPISMEPFEDTHPVATIRHCGHIFNESYLRDWFRINVHCPLCRYDIRDYDEPSSSPSAIPSGVPRQLGRTGAAATTTTTRTHSNERTPREPLHSISREPTTSTTSSMAGLLNSDHIVGRDRGSILGSHDDVEHAIMEENNVQHIMERFLTDLMSTGIMEEDPSGNSFEITFDFTAEPPTESIRIPIIVQEEVVSEEETNEDSIS